MNLIHVKYAVEVANAGSVNKAAEKLLIAPPNLSRSVKDLEAEFGITIFERSARGMSLTSDGERFIGYARRILSEVNELEKAFCAGTVQPKLFSVCVPEGSDYYGLFADTVAEAGKESMDFLFTQADLMSTLQLVKNGDCSLGIIRYSDVYDKYFRSMLQEKELTGDLIGEQNLMLLMHEENPLNFVDEICGDDLKDFVEICSPDSFVPPLPQNEVRRAGRPGSASRRIVTGDNSCRMEFLSRDPRTFSWSVPLSETTLARYGLIQKKCGGYSGKVREMLIRRNDTVLSEHESRFVLALMNKDGRSVGSGK